MVDTKPLDKLVLYDGVCALCNGTVKVLLKIDREGVLYYAPLQGETAKRILAEPAQPTSEIRSIVFVNHSEKGRMVHYRSDAFLAILDELGGIWNLTRHLLSLIPRTLRDRAYDFIAAHRYRWFGRYDSCPLPSTNVQERFLP